MSDFNIEITVGTNPAPEVSHEVTQKLTAGDNVIVHNKNLRPTFAAVFEIVNGVRTSISYTMVVDDEDEPLIKCIISVGQDIEEAYIKLKF